MSCGHESNTLGVKKLVQVSEEVQKPVHVPVVMGNECFIISQQDIRKIEDTRLISYHRLGPNGELIPIEAALGQDVALRDAITRAAIFHAQNQGDLAARQLVAIMGKSLRGDRPNGQIESSTKASVAQQMEWANSCTNTSPAYPLTYSKFTATDKLTEQRCCKQSCCCCSNCQPKYVIHKGCNTLETDPKEQQIEGPLSARQMLKVRKMVEDTMGI